MFNYSSHINTFCNEINHHTEIKVYTTEQLYFHKICKKDEMIAQIVFDQGNAKITYGRDNDSNYTYDYIDLQKVVNRASRKEMYFGRVYMCANISCAASCIQEHIENLVCFTSGDHTFVIGDTNSYHINEIFAIILREKDKRANNNLPKIILIPYKQRVGYFFSHEIVLIVDLELFPRKNSIYCFDSSHILIGPNGIKKNGSFGLLRNKIYPEAINKIKLQSIFKLTCTIWSEAFIVVAGKFIRDNYYKTNFRLDSLFIYINENAQLIEAEKDKIINLIGNWAIRWLPIWTFRQIDTS